MTSLLRYFLILNVSQHVVFEKHVKP